MTDTERPINDNAKNEYWRHTSWHSSRHYNSSNAKLALQLLPHKRPLKLAARYSRKQPPLHGYYALGAAMLRVIGRYSGRRMSWIMKAWDARAPKVQSALALPSQGGS